MPVVQDAQNSRTVDRFWTRADMLVEVASPENPASDYVQKRHDHAEAAITEYWIVDPRTESITALKLAMLSTLRTACTGGRIGQAR